MNQTRTPYAPPATRVADPPTPPASKPGAVKTAVACLWTSTAVAIVSAMLHASLFTGADAVTTIIGVALLGLIAAGASARRGWARWVFLVIWILGSFLGSLVMVFVPQLFLSFPWTLRVVFVVQFGLQTGALALLFTHAASDWFSAPREEAPEEPASPRMPGPVTAAAACPACGHEVSRDERQCPKCASAFALGSCPNCDQELPDSYLVCPKCRAQFGPGSSWQIRRRAIRRNSEADFAAILAIINDAAQAYRGVIPKDRWHEPYMPADELAREIAAGVAFWVEEEDGRLQGVMGMQDKGEVALVRHAYVAPKAQRSGVGTRLLRHVQGLTEKPILIGTWMDASWAIDFYLRNGFALLTRGEIDRVLPRYWSIPARQIETSVVLADARWTRANA